MASYHLDAWGNYRFPGELTASKNRFGFTGHIYDPETDLYFAKARYYDPETGRFTSQDPYLGQIDAPPSLHRYFYANANPTAFVDPDGFESLGEIAARERERRNLQTGQEPARSYTTNQAGEVVADGPVAMPKRDRTGDAMYEEELALDPDMRRRFAAAKAKAELPTTPTQVTEDQPEGTGDPYLDAELKRRADSFGAMRNVGKYGKKAGELGLSVASGTAGDVATALIGRDPVTGEEVGLGGRGLAVAGVLLPGVSGRELRVGKELVEEASKARRLAVNVAQGKRGEQEILERLLRNDAVEVVGVQIQARTAEGRRVMDILIRNKRTKELIAVEVKTGEATRSATQVAKDTRLAAGEGAATGRRAQAAGLGKGEKLPPLRTVEAKPQVRIEDDQP